MVFVIKGETPAKKNSRINTRSGRSFPSKRYTAWHDAALLQIPKNIRIEMSCSITLRFIHGDMRRRDSDNGTSSIMDLLVDSGLLKDDCWEIVRELHISNEYCKGKPMCIVTINLNGQEE